MSENADDNVYLIAGEFVLGVTTAAERELIERRLPQDAALREAVSYWEERLLPLTGLVQNEPMRADLWQRIEATLDLQGARRGVALPFFQRCWTSLTLWRGLAVGAVAIIVTLLTLQPILPWIDPPQPRFLVVLVAPESKSAGWVVQASSRSTVRLIPLGTAEIPKDRAMQVWTKADTWKGPVSLGLVKPGRSIDIRLHDLPRIEANQLFEITLEPANGSPLDRPTGPILFIGRAVPVL